MGNRLPKRPVVTGYLVSAALHIGLVGLTILLTVPSWPELDASPLTVRTIVSDRPVTDQGEHLLGTVDGLPSPPEVEEQAPSPNDLAVERAPSADDPGLADFARRRLEHATREAEEQSTAEQRADLETLGKRLQNVASEESVAELSGTLSKWLGVDERVNESQPDAEKEAVPFDASSAQISDVKKLETDAGVIYVAVLVDAAGQSSEAELDEIDGPQLYETFQLIKRFPLMEMVYRRTVMGLLDKLARESAPPAESTPPPASGSNSDGE